LQAGRSLVTAYLYRWEFMNCFQFNESGSFSSYSFTDAAWPIFVNKCQLGPGAAQHIGVFNRSGGEVDGLTFLPEAFSVDKLSYGIGFEDRPAELTWAIDDTITYSAGFLRAGQFTAPEDAFSPSFLTMKQAFVAGLFSEAPFWIHQAIYDDFPQNGGNFLGTTLMFRGFIRGVTASRSLLKIKLASLMDVFNDTQVPTQTMTPNNRALPYIPAALSAFGGDFAFVSAPGPQVIIFSTGESIPVNAMQDSWLVFNPATFAGTPAYQSGTPASPAFRIQGNSAASGGLITLYFYDTVVVPASISFLGFYSQLTTQGGNEGFKFLPPPEFSA
jgi:hypothetical protein